MIKTVAIGGGTGLSILLRGIKAHTKDIVAVVSVADDGGGSGVLREDLGMLPPGDIRNCILSLSNTEPLMEDLLRYRFKEGRLKDQNFGNLLIAAMVGISDSFEEAIRRMNLILAVTGKVLPVSVEDIELNAVLTNGVQVRGESNIPYQVLKTKSAIQRVYLTPENVKALPEVIEEILRADVIFLGPGSLYTSIIPNILISEIDDALHLAKAPKVFVTNLMTQPGETDHYSVRKHIESYYAHSRFEYITHVVVNQGMIEYETLNKYLGEDSTPVLTTPEDMEFLEKHHIKLIEGDFTEIKKGYLRHDAPKLVKAVFKYLGFKVMNK